MRQPSAAARTTHDVVSAARTAVAEATQSQSFARVGSLGKTAHSARLVTGSGDAVYLNGITTGKGFALYVSVRLNPEVHGETCRQSSTLRFDDATDVERIAAEAVKAVTGLTTIALAIYA